MRGAARRNTRDVLNAKARYWADRVAGENPDVYHGHAGVERYISAVEEVWDEFRIVPSEFIDGGDNVVRAAGLAGDSATG
jgi:hypothetical protein